MIKRNITQLLLDALSDTPVVLLNGARQTGKSSILVLYTGPESIPFGASLHALPVNALWHKPGK